ncbi:ShlB/FhaC/HecB family hemolysin secretion/activation protein [Enterobacillus tribolii]|nr:ShlB/FhaC/HecB family hemolysin secretion/activation protein [Enterobacillus tribolii]MBW7983645.1 ShlB/FhaC/HecB family hemolysin secretion/activation protein [Enterobacillus tribolii]
MTRKGIRLLTWFSLGSLCSFEGWAAPLSPSDRDTIQQQQRELLQQNQMQREELERSIAPSPRRGAALPENTGPCFPIYHIRLAGARLLTPERQQTLLAPYLDQCLGIKQISQLTQDVSDWYIRNGYITSRAFLTEQDLTQGQLTLLVMEGKLEEVRMNGQPDRTLSTTFPRLGNRILNLRDIEQGMEQINRVRREPVQIAIQPGSEPGYSVVDLEASKEIPVLLSAGFDNSGQKSTGEEQLNASVAINNLFGLADRWYVAGARSSAFSNSKDAQSVQAGVSMPYGYFTFDYSYSYSDYLATIESRGYEWRSTGDTQTHRLSGSWVAYRDSDIKTSLVLGMNHRSNNNYLSDVRLENSSYKLTSVLAGVNHGQKLWGGYATLNPAYSRGVPWLGASDDGRQAGSPKAEFNKWIVSGSYYRPLTDNISYLSSFYGQWTPDRLYGSERLTIGGESSVRGFKEQYLSGDKGGYWRNEVDWTLFRMPVIGAVGVVAAIDGGYLRHDKQEPYASGTLWGGAVGLTSNGKHFSSQLTVGWPLAYPDRLEPDRVSVYYRIGFVL